MRVAHALKKNGKNHGYFLIFLLLLAALGIRSELEGKVDNNDQLPLVEQRLKTDSGQKPIAVFPLENATNTPELNWLSIALQESLTANLSCISELPTRTLSDLKTSIIKNCPAMTLGCMTGLHTGESKSTESLKLFNWQEIAADAQLGQFLWGNYRSDGEDIEVHLELYGGTDWAPQDELTFKAALAELQQKSSNQIIRLLASRGTTIKPEERECILEARAKSVSEWKHTTLKYLFGIYRQAQLWEEGLKTTTMMEEDLKEGDLTSERMELVWWRAIFLQELEQFEESESAYHEVLSFKEQTLGSDHPDLSTILNNLALLNISVGNREKAKELFTRALAIDEKTYGPDHPRVAVRLNSLAKIAYDRGRHEEAQGLYKQVLTIDETIHGPQHPDVARDLSNLAGTFYALGKYSLAQPLYERALAIDQKTYGYEHPEVAKDLSNLAGIYFTLSRYAQAKLFYEKALAIDETIYGSKHPEVANDLNNLANLYQVLGNYEKAQSLYEQSLVISEKIYGSDHPSIATVLNNLGKLYSDLGKYGKAQPLYERALAIATKTYGHKHPQVALISNNLAGIHYASGEYSKAKALYQEALVIDKDYYGNEHPRVSIRLNNLAELYCAIEDYNQAQALYEKALLVAQISGEPELLWRIQFNFAYLLNQQDKTPAAIFFGKEAVNIIQRVRADISEIEKELQQSFLKTKWHVYKFLADLLIDLGRLPEAQQVLDMQKEEEYFEFLCRNTGRQDVRTTSATYTDEEIDRSERYREISNHIAALGKEFAELKKKKKFGLTDKELNRYQQLTDDLKVARKAFADYLAQLIDALSTASRERYAEVKAKRLDKPRKLQQALQELGHGAVVIHYLIIENKLRIILTTTEMQLARDVDISSKDLNHKIMAFRKTVQNPRQAPFDQARELYEIILAPIDQDLRQAGAQTLMLSLDDVLRYLPVAALHDGESYLIERYRIALYTAAAGLDIKDRPTSRWLVGGFGLSRAIGDLEPLPHVPEELEGIVRRDVSDQDGVLPGVIYLDDSFSRETIESVLMEEFPVVHIASHFELKPGTKDDSHLVLGNGETLTLAAIKDSDYDFGDVEMLTLSACNTAVGGTGANGSEVESFGTLAQDQGAKGVLATLWPVADRSTGVLMQNFYRLHEDQPGMTKAEALRQSQLLFVKGKSAAGTLEETRRGMRVSQVKRETERVEETPFIAENNNPYSHPFYWAPFILMGNWL